MASANETSRAARAGGRGALPRRKRTGHPGRAVGVLAALMLSVLPCAAHTGTPAAEDQVRIMTFNILRGGTELGQPLSQTAKVITEGGADVVGLQETGRNAEALAESLRWNLIRQDQGRAILTRHEIVAIRHGEAIIRLASGREFHILNVHLPSAPYQPYQLLGIPYSDAPFIKTEGEAVASAGKARGIVRNGVAVVGEDREHADAVVAPYPSDHRAVVASFTLFRELP